MTDQIINFYEKLPKHLKSETKLDKNFKQHYIQIAKHCRTKILFNFDLV